LLRKRGEIPFNNNRYVGVLIPEKALAAVSKGDTVSHQSGQNPGSVPRRTRIT
jgi:hypothetical protein